MLTQHARASWIIGESLFQKTLRAGVVAAIVEQPAQMEQCGLVLRLLLHEPGQRLDRLGQLHFQRGQESALHGARPQLDVVAVAHGVGDEIVVKVVAPRLLVQEFAVSVEPLADVIHDAALAANIGVGLGTDALPQLGIAGQAVEALEQSRPYGTSARFRLDAPSRDTLQIGIDPGDSVCGVFQILHVRAAAVVAGRQQRSQTDIQGR